MIMKKTIKKAMPKAKYNEGGPKKTLNVTNIKDVDAKKIRKNQGDTTFVVNKVSRMSGQDSAAAAPYMKNRLSMAKKKKGGATKAKKK